MAEGSPWETGEKDGRGRGYVSQVTKIPSPLVMVLEVEVGERHPIADAGGVALELERAIAGGALASSESFRQRRAFGGCR